MFQEQLADEPMRSLAAAAVIEKNPVHSSLPCYDVFSIFRQSEKNTGDRRKLILARREPILKGEV
jgi:hypothetical protein